MYGHIQIIYFKNKIIFGVQQKHKYIFFNK